MVKESILSCIAGLFSLSSDELKSIDITSKDSMFGDFSCNAAMILSKKLNKPPREIASQIKESLLNDLKTIDRIEIAGPGFINIFLLKSTWTQIGTELLDKKEEYYKIKNGKKKYLLEFVSANPTGPLHLGHGRGGIIGDTLARILNLIGHEAKKEFYINDTGNQIKNLGISLKIRCQQELGSDPDLSVIEINEDGYKGEYLIDVAKECIKEHGKSVLEKDDTFFEDYAKRSMLKLIKEDLNSYGVHFDNWFSESSLHKDGSIDVVIELLKKKDLIYEEDGALWFKSTQFGDDKDRVIKKQDGTLTYIAPDIAYHKNKFDRGFDILIDVLGQDHHGYVKRLKATMEGLGYPPSALQVILYQLVSIKAGDASVKMSKRSGTFTTLYEIIETVGVDVARFFYLNRKAEAHLDFDLETALKKTDENPAYYVQYAYVRINSLLKKAAKAGIKPTNLNDISDPEIKIIKKLISLNDILENISRTYHTHLLAYYTIELAKEFHSYYANNRIINPEDIKTSGMRLLIANMVKNQLSLCLDLLGLSKPESM